MRCTLCNSMAPHQIEQVTQWRSSCGNGIVEGLEECDDGDLADGNGCSWECRVEAGWRCVGSAPSVCTRRVRARVPYFLPFDTLIATRISGSPRLDTQPNGRFRR